VTVTVPEAFVSVVAAYTGTPGLALGNGFAFPFAFFSLTADASGDRSGSATSAAAFFDVAREAFFCEVLLSFFSFGAIFGYLPLVKNVEDVNGANPMKTRPFPDKVFR